MPSNPPARNGRLGSRKTKTGCKTCKIRRVKCDEAKPSCVRCTSTGRRCDGYEAIAQPPRPTLKPRTDLTTVQISSNDQHAFDFYIKCTAPTLSGSLDKAFWADLVPKLSLSFPAVLDAVVAISSLIEHPQWDDYPVSGKGITGAAVTDRHHRYALGAYSRAISRLDISKAQPEILLVALVSAILFICIEFLEDNVERAVTLFQSGGKILQGIWDNKSDFPKDIALIIEEVLVPMFTRLDVHRNMTGQARRLVSPPFGSRVVISSLNDARMTLFSTMTMRQDLLKFAFVHKITENRDFPIPPELIAARQAREKHLREWHAAFSDFFRKMHNAVDLYVSSILFMQYESAMIWVQTMFDPFETCYDQLTPHFRNMVRHARTAIETSPKGPVHTANTGVGGNKTFQFEVGTIMPLYYAALRCRDPQVRREALQLMYKGPRKEGPYKSIPFAKLAEKIMEIEEQGLTISSDWMVEIPEEHRIKSIDILETPLPATGKLQWGFKYTRFHQKEIGSWQEETGVCALDNYDSIDPMPFFEHGTIQADTAEQWRWTGTGLMRK